MQNPTLLKKIAEQLAIDVDNYCDRKWKDENRGHLGFSLIGDDCQRKLWYGFRWCLTPKPSPRIKRLFDRGHKEEDRFIDYLRGIGCTVNPFDYSYRLFYSVDNKEYFVLQCTDDLHVEQAIGSGCLDVSDDMQHVKNANDVGITYPKQWRVSAVYGHSGGSLDGRGYLPPEYGIDDEVLFEFKTHNDKSFKALQKDGMKVTKPTHYAQCCSYGYILGLKYVVYVAVNKNDDDLYFEVLELNAKTGEMMCVKADRIIRTQEPPPRLHENPTYWLCKGCNYYPICHSDRPIDRNCRSCKHAEPIQNGKWGCNKHNQELNDDIIGKQWDCWESIV